jgi:hypothetical protein
MTKHPEFHRLESVVEAGEVILTVDALLRALHNAGTFVYHSDGRGEHVVSVRRLTQRLEQEGARCKAAAT